MIQLHNVNKFYFTKELKTQALKDINLHIEKGEFVSIMGPSGCGKSTLLSLIGLLDEASSGDIVVDSQIVGKYDNIRYADIRKNKIGFIFQSFNLINQLNVYENIELPLLYRKISNSERKKRIQEALELVKLSTRSKHLPSQLSGGQQQRVAIARTLVCQPEILLADEPTGNLDSEMGQEIMDILRNLNKEKGITTIMVTHDETHAKYTERIIKLFDGQIVNVKYEHAG
jgi:putative ABC transport system ATP-binding protein